MTTGLPTADLRRARRQILGLAPLGAAGLAMSLASPAVAGDFEILDHVPADAAIVVAVDNPGSLKGSLQGLVGRFGEIAAMPEIAGVFAQLDGVFTTPGLNANGPMAVVVMPEALAELGRVIDAELQGQPGDGPDEATLMSNVFAMFTCPDLESVATSFGAAPDGDFYTGAVSFGEVGEGFAAVAANTEVFESFDTTAGKLGGHAERLGGMGRRVLEDADAVVVVDVPTIGRGAAEKLAALRQLAQFQAALLGPEGEQLMGSVAALENVVLATLQQGRTMMAGLQFADNGVVLDLAAEFQDDTTIAGYLADGGRSTPHLGRLPDRNFILAYAADYAAPGLSEMVGKAFELAEAATGQPGAPGFADVFNGSSAAAQMLAVSPTAALGFGFFSDTVQLVVTESPEQTRDGVREAFREMNGQNLNGVSVSSSYIDGGGRIGNREVDTYSFVARSTGPANGFIDPNQINALLFGPSGGPNGFVTSIGDTLIMTGSQNPDLAQAAIASVQNGQGLAANRFVAAAAGMLPEDRFVEGYFAFDQVVNMVRPLLAGFLGVNLPAPGDIPPIAFGGSAEDGGMLMRLFVPNEFLDLTAQLTEQFAPLLGGLDAGGAPPPQQEQPGNRPRF